MPLQGSCHPRRGCAALFAIAQHARCESVHARCESVLHNRQLLQHPLQAYVLMFVADSSLRSITENWLHRDGPSVLKPRYDRGARLTINAGLDLACAKPAHQLPRLPSLMNDLCFFELIHERQGAPQAAA